MDRAMAYTETVPEFFGRLALPANDQITGIAEFQIEDDKNYRFDLASGNSVKKRVAPDIIVRARANDFMALVEGRMSVEDGILTERLHVAGDMIKITQLIGALKMVQSS
jgi:putative sterol carrier protein